MLSLTVKICMGFHVTIAVLMLDICTGLPVVLTLIESPCLVRRGLRSLRFLYRAANGRRFVEFSVRQRREHQIDFLRKGLEDFS